MSAAVALTHIAPADERVIPRMRRRLSSPNADVRDHARTYLRPLGQLPVDTADLP